MKPLSVCLCTTYYPPTSSNEDGVYVSALANALATAGHAVTVVHNPAAIDCTAPDAIRTPNTDHASICHRPVASRGGTWGVLALHQSGRPVGMRESLESVLSEPFDVIHFHNVSLLGGPAILALGCKPSMAHSGSSTAPLRLVSLNDHWLVCPTHLLWKWTNTVCTVPSCTVCSLRQGKPPQLWRSTRLMQRSLDAVDAVIGPSRLTIDAHHARGIRQPIVHLPGLHVPVSRSGVCAESDSPFKTDGIDTPCPSSSYFLLSSRLEPHKGVDAFLDAFETVPTRHRLLITGVGRDASRLRYRTRHMINVQWLPPQSPGALERLCRQATASVITTQALQTFCHTTAASFACGTPVIGLARGVVAEIVCRHGGGLLYTDATGLAVAMDRLADEGALRIRLACEARATYEAQFSIDVYLPRYLGLIDALMARKRTSTTSVVAGSISRIAGLEVHHRC